MLTLFIDTINTDETFTEVVNDTINNVAAQQSAVPEVTETSLPIWDLCMQGGILMIPLLILSLISIYILVERAIVINRAARHDENFMKRIKDYIHEGEIESAMNLCKKDNSPYSRLIAKGISRIGRPMQDVLVTIENTGNIEVANLGKGLPWLATTAAGAPMLGFLGTVIGMVQAFFDISSQGNAASISTFAGGIYTALVTTVAGLVVGVIALFAYNYLVARIEKLVFQMEANSIAFMDILNQPVK